jgi:hypothetical protein
MKLNPEDVAEIRKSKLSLNEPRSKYADANRSTRGSGHSREQQGVADAVRRAAETDMNAQHLKRWAPTR